ncbi:flagellar assembly protein FliH [Campylobacter sp. MIT 97-5078]|uniref:flagellar assembly protein FliH n=1 Tax=Campylobacter sp. MIT 97-5078 TaxID=1548153 RepID=UPI0005131896|nr:flagellar assembly protein FliH [Campylobacter sp. MIT 97-5078]KGI56573.1 flagellar assembly protein FliH [Campylobacter sp. MIT 97-5078]TQR26765.1 flagellar assembly protein FliH [Campylobacter sp. MIT 97-5078]
MAKNTNVISQSNANEHIVENYHFKVMSEFTSTQEQNRIQEALNVPVPPATTPAMPLEEKPNSQVVEPTLQDPLEESKSEANTPFQSSFVEDLLKKTDEMSGNIIKLQMQIESQESEFNNRLNAELEGAKEKFTQEGYNKAKAEFDKETNELKDKYLKSVAKLDEACANLDVFVAKNEQELANTAIEIAKEVINKELEEHSAQIALNLSKELISELKGAVSIELKVSPSDYDFVKSQLKELAHLKVSLDDAISKGSVIVLSDVGNIESNLNSRLNKIKKMVSQ